MTLRQLLHRMAQARPEMRQHLVPMLRKTASHNIHDLYAFYATATRLPSRVDPSDLDSFDAIGDPTRPVADDLMLFLQRNPKMWAVEDNPITFSGKLEKDFDVDTEFTPITRGYRDPAYAEEVSVGVTIEGPETATGQLTMEIPTDILLGFFLAFWQKKGLAFQASEAKRNLAKHARAWAYLLQDLSDVLSAMNIGDDPPPGGSDQFQDALVDRYADHVEISLDEDLLDKSEIDYSSGVDSYGIYDFKVDEKQAVTQSKTYISGAFQVTFYLRATA